MKIIEKIQANCKDSSFSCIIDWIKGIEEEEKVQ